MGKLEEASKKRKTKKDIKGVVLATLASAGELALNIITTDTLQLLRYQTLDEGRRLRYRTKTAAKRLIKNGHAVWTEKEGQYYLRITDRGRKALAFEQAKVSLKNQKTDQKTSQVKWDGRWRMVIFDVPEQRRGVRKKLCALMCEVGFILLQKSVWVYPYDCEDFIALLKVELKIGKDVLYAIVDTIEQDIDIRRHFKLPLE